MTDDNELVRIERAWNEERENGLDLLPLQRYVQKDRRLNLWYCTSSSFIVDIVTLRSSRNEGNERLVQRLVLEVDPSGEDLDQALDRLPPLGLAPPVLKVGSGHHLVDTNEANASALNCDRRRSGTGLSGRRE